MNWKDSDRNSHYKNGDWYCNVTVGYDNKWYWEVAHSDSFTNHLDDRVYTGISTSREDGKMICENKLIEIQQ